MRTVVLGPAIALMAGAACGTFIDVPVPECAALLAASWLTSILAYGAKRPAVLAGAVAAGFASGGALIAAGAAVDRHEPSILQHLSGDPLVLEGDVREDAAPTEFGATMTLDVAGVQVGSRFVSAGGGVRLAIGGAYAAAGVREWRAGRRLRVTATLRRPVAYRNFGVPDQERRLALDGIRLVGSVKSAALVSVVGRASAWREASGEMRAWSRRAIDRAIARRDPEAAAIVTAVLIGDRAGLSSDVERRLQRAGTFHVIAISGGNVALLAGLVVWGLARSGLSPRLRATLAMGGLAAYAAIVMGGASVARATLAAAVYLAARALDLRTPARNVIVVTMATILAVDPILVADTGFWLTFLASLAIVAQVTWVSARIERGWLAVGGWPARAPARAAMSLLAATIVADAALVPIAASAFSQVTVAGLLLNFVAIPLMALVQSAGLATLAAASVHPDLAVVPGAFAGWGARAIVESARLVDAAPWTVLRVPGPPLWLVAACVATWMMAWFATTRVVRVTGRITWVASLGLILSGPVLPEAPASVLRHPPCRPTAGSVEGARLTVLDVAQGAAALMRVTDLEPILVDAGGAGYASRFDVGSRVVSPALWALGVRRLAVLVLTHGDGDHVGGAPAIVRDFGPIEIWEGVPVPNLAAIEGVRAVAGANVAWNRIRRGQSRLVGDAVLHVWHPPVPEWERRRVRNDDSIVLELRVGQVSIVLPGDISAAVEQDVAPLMAPSRLRILVAAHHGSHGATSRAWLQRIDPRVVIVSAGRDNSYGHPARTMLDRVRAHGASIYRTDLDGAIEVDTDGSAVAVTTCSGRTARITQ